MVRNLRWMSTTERPDDLRFYRRPQQTPQPESLNVFCDETAIIEQNPEFYQAILDRMTDGP